MSPVSIVFGLILAVLVVASAEAVEGCKSLVESDDVETPIGTVCISGPTTENATLTYSMFQENALRMDEIVFWMGKDISNVPKSVFGCPDTRFFPYTIEGTHMKTVSTSVQKSEPLYLVAKISVHNTNTNEKTEAWSEGESICMFEFSPLTTLLPDPLVERNPPPNKPVRHFSGLIR